MRGYHYVKASSRQWAWGPTSHWRLYFSLKTISKRCASFIAATNNISTSQDRRRRPNCQHRHRSRHTSNFGGENQYRFPDFTQVTITDSDVNEMIRENELTIEEFPDLQLVEKCEINQLKSNNPNEDQVFVTQSSPKEGLLIGVLDGHGGSVYGEQMKARLPYYLHTSLVDKSKIGSSTLDIESSVRHLHTDEYIIENSINSDIWVEKVASYKNELLDLNEEENSSKSQSPITTSLLQMIGKQGEAEKRSVNLGKAIKDAFLKLDQDVIKELLHLANTNKLCQESLQLATSGCCALVAYIIENNLHIANLGDCRAVLGSNKDGNWKAVQLTYDHTAASNSAEVQRIISEHPPEEARSCLSYGRLLGRLAPLRALGDIQFKLEAEDLYSIFQNVPKYAPFSASLTPPYLTAEPDVFHYKLEPPNDRFIVLASDGLWDMLSNEEVVQLVASYLEGRQKEVMEEQAQFYNVPDCDKLDADSFADVEGENVASFLLRQALGGYDKGNLKAMLSMKYPDTRLYRDDISIAVIFLNNPNDESFAVLETSDVE